jgi:hypothetical protein
MRRNYNRRLFESEGVSVIALLPDMMPATDLSFLVEGDVITEDMIDSHDDEDLMELVNIASEVAVAEVTDENVFTLSVTLDTQTACKLFKGWAADYGYAKTDAELEEQAPGILAAINGTDEYDDVDDFADDIDESESVSSRFSRYRRLYEADDDDMSNLFGGDESDDEDADKDDADDKDTDDADDSEDGDDEDVPMTAVILTVSKDDAEKCKDELVDAGIDEDMIEILDGDEDEDTSEIKVDVDAVDELKTYLDKKGINLEDEIGGEIVSDEDSEDGEDKDSDKDGEEEEDDDNTDFGDLFAGDDEEDSDEK